MEGSAEDSNECFTGGFVERSTGYVVKGVVERAMQSETLLLSSTAKTQGPAGLITVSYLADQECKEDPRRQRQNNQPSK